MSGMLGTLVGGCSDSTEQSPSQQGPHFHMRALGCVCIGIEAPESSLDEWFVVNRLMY